MTRKITNSLDAFKKKIGQDNSLEIQQENGELFPTRFEWSQPAFKEEIEKLQELTGWKIPEDFKQFLLLHNGARLFITDDEMSSLNLYSIGDIIAFYNNDYEVYINAGFPKGWYMIGSYHGYGEYIFIDSNLVEQNSFGYMGYTQVGNMLEINLNFETWLDRVLIAQGVRYWLWEN